MQAAVARKKSIDEHPYTTLRLLARPGGPVGLGKGGDHKYPENGHPLPPPPPILAPGSTSDPGGGA